MVQHKQIPGARITQRTLAVGLLATLGVSFAARDGAARVQVPVRAAPIDSTILKGFKWRNIGPQRGGRSIAVSGVKGRPREAYFGATGGGLWKTTDGGQSWAPVTDGQLTSASVGAVAVSESNPDVVYIGMGESPIRGNIMAGDGVYKSIDAGKTWKHIGFTEAQNISRIRIDPTNPDIVYVAAFGRYSVPNEERGVFKSTDGGTTWKKVLFRDGKTAAIDLSMDRKNPKVLYAGLWEAYRKEYQMSSGGPGSGLFKSTDAGETWTELTHNPGLPSGVIGKVGVSVSGANSNRVWAMIENENGGLFRSDDAGATWSRINENRNIRQRAFYFSHVAADVTDSNLVYLLNVSLYKSPDGGNALVALGGSHSDNHDLWVDPDNNKHIVLANDGGGVVSMDGGATWTGQEYSTSQLYHVVATAHYPYHLCAAQQDASTICVPSNTGLGGRGGRGGGGGGGAARPVDPLANTYNVAGAEPGYIAPDPRDPDVFFSGGNNGSFLDRLNRRTGQVREVSPYPRMFSGEPSTDLRERWQWTYPIMFSPVDPKILYTGSQHLWKTINGGQSWERISGDLTRHDPATMGISGGPITHDMNGPEVYGVIFAIGPSRRDVNVIWTGSDDGLVHLTRDGGKTWTNVTPKGMPDFGRVSIIDASAFDIGTAYVAVKRPLLNDFAPYIFRTHDFGKTWARVVTGIREDAYVHAVREDPSRRGLLYAATQHGVYMSYDDGDHWESLSLDLPDIPISDLLVHGSDLAISTHGRGFYILDNVAPLQQNTAAVTAAPDLWAYTPQPAIRSGTQAALTYWLKHDTKSVSIEILDSAGVIVRSYVPDTAAAGGRGGAGGGGGGGGGRGGFSAAPPKATGFNNFSWDLRYTAATSFPGMILWGGSTQGPMAAPGTYRARITADGHSQTVAFTVKRNPLFTDVTNADLRAQFALAIKLRDKVTEANQAVIDIRRIRDAVKDRLSKSSDTTLKVAGDRLVANITAVEEEIYQVRNQSGQDPLNFPIKVNNRLASLLGIVGGADGKPIANADPIFRDLVGELKVQTDRLQKALTKDLPAFNAEAKRLGLAPVDATVPKLMKM